VNRIVGLSVGLILALGISEFALRVLGLAPVDGVTTVTESEYARLPGIFAPDQTLIDRHRPALPFRVTIDSLGYRGPDFNRHKTTGEMRVVLAGDSFTYGEYVDDDQTLPAQLERGLRTRCGNVRVINAGLVGTTITDEAAMVERALSMAPDLIVVVFSENDVTDLAVTPMWTLLARNRRVKSRFPLSATYRLLRRTALWNLGLQVAGAMRGRAAAAQGEAAAVEYAASRSEDDRILQLRERYRQAFVALRDTLNGRGIPFTLAAYPFYLTVSGRKTPEQINWVVQMAQAAGVPAVNLLPPLQNAGAPTTSLYLLPIDGHPSPRGYAIAAAHLAERLSKTRLLASNCR
jgi:lysophospholipase L1-like esterase